MPNKEIEVEVIDAFVQSALANECLISVHDGEEIVCLKSDNAQSILHSLFSVDEETLIVYDKNHKKLGCVYLVHGNDGYDVIADYHISLEYLMDKANEVSDYYA